MVVAGIECASGSGLNSKRKDCRDAVATGQHKTGTTFAFLMNYVRLHLPAIIVLENGENFVRKQGGTSGFDQALIPFTLDTNASQIQYI